MKNFLRYDSCIQQIWEYCCGGMRQHATGAEYYGAIINNKTIYSYTFLIIRQLLVGPHLSCKKVYLMEQQEEAEVQLGLIFQ